MEAELFHVDRRTDKHEEESSRLSQTCKSAQNILRIKLNLRIRRKCNNVKNFT
jgi:hypothetical protein